MVCQRLKNRNSRKRQQRKQRKGIINKVTQGNFPEENASLLFENITQVPRIRDENRTLYMSLQNSREKNHVLQIVRYREGSRGKGHIQKGQDINDPRALKATLETRSQTPVSAILGYSHPQV